MAFLISLLILFFNGCSHMSYMWQAGMGQFSLYNHERPLAEVIEDPKTSADVREKLQWIPEIKTFVEKTLSVKATANYITYVDLKRPYVVWSLTSAPSYKLELKEWSFPFVGSVPYLGFFKQEKAENWAKDERAQGNDTYIRGVSAYSTLGYLRDPFLSTMLSRSKADIVNLIFHETTHGQVYLKGEGSFNEQAASFIGDYGEKAWIESTYGTQSQELKDWEVRRINRRRFGKILNEFSDRLKKDYEKWENVSLEQKQSLKEKAFNDLRETLNAGPWNGSKEQYSWMMRLIQDFTNNAALLAYLTYEDKQEVFDLLNEKCKGSLPGSLRVLKRFSKEYSSLKEHFSQTGKASAQGLFSAWLVAQTSRDVCFNSDI